jgi:hypothetical protein
MTAPVSRRLSFEDWVLYGREHGWVSEIICDRHDGIPMTPGEEQELEDDEDICIHVMRLYPDIQTKLEAESNR